MRTIKNLCELVKLRFVSLEPSSMFFAPYMGRFDLCHIVLVSCVALSVYVSLCPKTFISVSQDVSCISVSQDVSCISVSQDVYLCIPGRVSLYTIIRTCISVCHDQDVYLCIPGHVCIICVSQDVYPMTRTCICVSQGCPRN